jgi:hypothetical protein
MSPAGQLFLQAHQRLVQRANGGGAVADGESTFDAETDGERGGGDPCAVKRRGDAEWTPRKTYGVERVGMIPYPCDGRECGDDGAARFLRDG